MLSPLSVSRLLSLCLLLCLIPTAHGKVLSIGHRGDSLFAPENTIASFKSALPKADLVELDTYTSSDGVLVVMHDSDVKRTTDGTGAITSMTLAQIRALDAGSWFAEAFTGEKVPTLEEAITNIAPQALVLIERKQGTAAAHLDLITRIGAVTNVVVQSFDWTFLANLRALHPTIRLGALGSGTFTATTLTNILNAGANMVAWEKSGVTADVVSMVHGAGLQLFVWTVDGPDILNYVNLGVDGIISNDPGMVRQLQSGAQTGGDVNLAADLFMYWRMDNGLTNSMATTVTDNKGAGSTTLTRLDAVSHWGTTTEAKFGSCVHLDKNAFIPVPQNGATEIGSNAMTFSAWIKLTALPSAMATAYGAVFDSTNDCFSVYLDRSNKELRFKVTDVTGAAARPGIPESKLSTGTWLHIAATYTGAAGPVSGQTTIYLNGVPTDVHTGSDSSSPFGLTSIVKSNNFAAIGREGVLGGNYFIGSLDDVAIWRRALGASEVVALYSNGVAGLSLGDQLRKPTEYLRMRSLQRTAENQMQIFFTPNIAWTNYRLLRSTSLNGPFIPVYGLTPEYLGRGIWRFTLPYSVPSLTLYRVEAE